VDDDNDDDDNDNNNNNNNNGIRHNVHKTYKLLIKYKVNHAHCFSP
jgi:hypothetical protein